MLPFSLSCENNKAAILDVLSRVFADRCKVLELAAGTGQHASWFASHLPQLCWQPSDITANLDYLQPRCEVYTGANLLPPLALDVQQRPWPLEMTYDAVFTANSLHIMGWNEVCELFSELGERSLPGLVFAVYGPFNYQGQYTSQSNASFDLWLAQRNAQSAIRHFEEVSELATAAGFMLLEDNPMPANNRLLIWRRRL